METQDPMLRDSLSITLANGRAFQIEEPPRRRRRQILVRIRELKLEDMLGDGLAQMNVWEAIAKVDAILEFLLASFPETFTGHEEDIRDNTTELEAINSLGLVVGFVLRPFLEEEVLKVEERDDMTETQKEMVRQLKRALDLSMKHT